jgi:23S rRNA (uracil1939-C5)-methyltransferase
MATTKELRIEKFTLGGQGIGYIDGKVCFVDRVIPGELVQAEIVTDKKDYSVANALNVIEPSPHRITPICPVYNRCGGCQLQHVRYEHQVELKKAMFSDALKHIGKFEADIDSFTHDDPWHYRSRIQIPVQYRNALQIGYYQPRTHKVINHESCPLHDPLINETEKIVRQSIIDSGITIYDESSATGDLRHLIIKTGARTRQVFITFVTRETMVPVTLYKQLDKKIPGLAGVTHNINPGRTNRISGDRENLLLGKAYYEEKIGNMVLCISSLSFFQVNTPVFHLILETIKKNIRLTGTETVLDLYAGMGVIGFYCSRNAKQVIGIEENPAAVQDGRTNAQANNIDNMSFLESTVEAGINKIEAADIVLLDPPRKGVAEPVLEKIAELGVSTVVYLSCNPATFARDSQQLMIRNFRITSMYLFDMFPQTYHIESLAFFQKA